VVVREVIVRTRAEAQAILAMQARAALAAVYRTFAEGFTTPDLVDATALRNSLA
jgi:hypothetical protein